MGENPQDGLGVGPCSRGDRASAASWSHNGSVSGANSVSEAYTTMTSGDPSESSESSTTTTVGETSATDSWSGFPRIPSGEK